MEQKILQRSRWKIPQVEIFYYQFYFLNYFSKYNPEFIREMETDLFPLYLDIFGRHEKTTPTLSEYNWMLAVAVAEKDHLLFAVQIQSKLKIVYEAVNQKSLSEEELKIKTDILLNKITDVLKRHNLFFGSDDENTPFWLAHSMLCQIEAGIPYLITPIRHIVFELPFKMLEALWRELPEIEQALFMKSHETYYNGLSEYHSRKKHFESLDIFMANYPYKTLPAAPMFAFREYNIYEDIENYEKMAVEAYKQHIKNYTKRMTKTLDENFKRNNTDDYSQTEWLVIWNKYKFVYLWEIFPYITDFQKVDLNNNKAKKTAEDRLRKAFNKFEMFDLPVRPFGLKRKNSKQKTGANVSSAKK